MADRCAVIGVGQTHLKAKREDVSIPGLVREAAQRALADAELTFADIDAVVIGKAPDMFEGVMMPELSLAANPIMTAGLARIGEAATRIWSGDSNRAVAHATSGPCLQQNLVCVLDAAWEGA